MVPNRRKGLVLEGGGAKGAYAFGWLRAFHEHGVEFDAVAGTSVGGINAAIWGTNQLASGEQFWAHMSQDDVYPFRRPRVIFLPLGVLDGLFQLIRERAERSGMGMLLNAAAIWGLVAAPYLLFELFAYRRTPTLDVQGDLALAAMMASICVPALIVVVYPVLLNVLGLSILLSSPLRQNVANCLGDKQLSIPTYVTIARKQSVWDPDDLAAGGAYTAKVTLFSSKVKYVPDYLNVTSVTPDERLTAVLASAAIPYGIVTSQVVGTSFAVDGGVADNLPLYPLVSLENCDVIVVIHLRPYSEAEAGPDPESYKKAWQRIDHRLRAAQLTRDDVIATRDRHPDNEGSGEYIKMTLPVREPAKWPARIVSIAPTKGIGGFLDGTLNFSRLYTRRLLALGYADAQLQGDEFWALLK